MKRRILYIGEPETCALYADGKVPSHWLYGAAEMEREGHTVQWAAERPSLFNDMALIRRYSPDIIFIPNLNLNNHRLLLALKAMGLVRIPVYAYLHHGRPDAAGVRGALTRFLLSGVDHLFFLSEKSMRETIDSGMVAAQRASCPGWGADMDFYGKVTTTDGGRFVSTGKENRDFDILIEAFRITGAPLTIMTTLKHGANTYDTLADKCRGIDNIELVITENTGNVYPSMLTAMASARALVCPLLRDHLDYCVGLSTIADAQGLGKPLIITDNPYHDSRRMTDNTIRVTTLEQWVDAIRRLSASAVPSAAPTATMSAAWQKMKTTMFGQ